MVHVTDAERNAERNAEIDAENHSGEITFAHPSLPQQRLQAAEPAPRVRSHHSKTRHRMGDAPYGVQTLGSLTVAPLLIVAVTSPILRAL